MRASITPTSANPYPLIPGGLSSKLLGAKKVVEGYKQHADEMVARGLNRLAEVINDRYKKAFAFVDRAERLILRAQKIREEGNGVRDSSSYIEEAQQLEYKATKELEECDFR